MLVLVSALFAADPIRDAVTLGGVAEARLDLSLGYLAVAPFSSVLDTLSLLGARQHVALLISLGLVYVAVRIWRRARARRAPAPSTAAVPASGARTWSREALLAALSFVALLTVYGFGALAPRPMAAIALTPGDLYLSVDFHSHTRFSHDGRWGWDPEDVRAWHRSGGFDAAYISDHRTVEGAELGMANNPAQAGQGTMLLQALELGWHGEHVNVVNAERVYKGLTTPGLRDLDDQGLTLASMLAGREPIVIETIPGRPDRIIAAAGPGTAGVRALELVDGAPRGLDQSRLQRARLVRLADSLHLALVAGSDNHGWGRAVPAWTLLRIPGWRGMSGDSLAYAIERTLRLGNNATRVVERRIDGELDTTSAVRLALTLPLVTWRMLTTLTADERIMWVVWAWALSASARLAAGWRRRRRIRVA